jgi:MFS transporter, NNP family, nitrate/nitrite transporter
LQLLEGAPMSSRWGRVSMLGMGNGAIFKMTPQRLSTDIELIPGIVGTAGGLGGFFLLSALGR